MEMTDADYDRLIDERAEHVFDVMRTRVSPLELEKLREAFELAKTAHAPQRRKTGEPYILHPVAVATIAAEELSLDAASVMAAFLHDVVEDTNIPLSEIRQRFGDDVAFLVDVVTKKKQPEYVDSKQVDNYRQMLDSVQYDIRALLVKLSDRLHNMRTLSSMRPDKQMKIAGETDYFYAPLANRLGLYHVKTELENLGLKFRCPHDYEEITTLIARDERDQKARLDAFRNEIKATLDAAGISARVYVEYRKPYSIWRKMRKFGDDFNHLKYRHFTEIVYRTPKNMSEKDMALRIYSVLTNRFKEKPGGITNYIDSPKENGYQSFHLKLLADFGRWQEVHISSDRMIRDSQLGCMADRSEDNIARWIDKFRHILKDIAARGHKGTSFIENVVRSFYNDDIMTFTPKGRPVVLPQRSTVLDFAYELNRELGEHAQYARVNGFLTPIKSPLRRGDVVEIFTNPDSRPRRDWLDAVVSYKARQAIEAYLNRLPKPAYHRCPHCKPIPCEEVVGFAEDLNDPGRLDPEEKLLTIHRRDCPIAIRLASQFGDSIRSVEFKPDDTLYPIAVTIRAVDRYHLLIDLVDCITNQLHLAITSINTGTTDSIVTCRLTFGVHSFAEVQEIIRHISAIPAVDEVKWE